MPMSKYVISNFHLHELISHFLNLNFAYVGLTMDEEGYYTNLLNESEDNNAMALLSFSSTPATQQSLNVENIGNTRPNQKRSKNFSEDEDKLLVTSWLNVGIDPVRGTNQTCGAFWKRISEFFHSNKEFSSDRSQNSLVHRWSTIQESVNKFCGCLAQIESRRQSGVTIQDKVL